jgi:hypothetical protein
MLSRIRCRRSIRYLTNLDNARPPSEMSPFSQYFLMGKSLRPLLCCLALKFNFCCSIYSFAMTGSTDSDASAFMNVCVFRREFMPVLTMSLSCTLGKRTIGSINDINSVRNGIEVVGIDAKRISAEMVDIKSGWNGSLYQFISDTMSRSDFSILIDMAVTFLFACRIVICSGRPNPTGPSLFDFRPKTNFERWILAQC